MLMLLKKQIKRIKLMLIIFSLLTAWFYPALGLMLGTILLVLTLAISCISVVPEHRKSYLQGEITFLIFMQNAALEISGILLATLCAVLFGNYIARLATHSIDDALIRFAAGVFIGLLIGIAIGALVRKFWNTYLIQQIK